MNFKLGQATTESTSKTSQHRANSSKSKLYVYYVINGVEKKCLRKATEESALTVFDAVSEQRSIVTIEIISQGGFIIVKSRPLLEKLLAKGYKPKKDWKHRIIVK